MDRTIYKICRSPQDYVLKCQICVREYLKNFFHLWRFDPIPCHGFHLRGFKITLIGHTTPGKNPLDE